MYCNKNSYADYLPVDIAANAILVSTLNFIYFKDYEKRVYNLTSSSEFKVLKINILRALETRMLICQYICNNISVFIVKIQK